MRTSTVLKNPFEPSPTEPSPTGRPMPADYPEDLLDQDAVVEGSPGRILKSVQVRFVKAGYRKPKIADDLED